MTVQRWFAPGKMMWIGEYAVLDGAPAVVAAVDRGVVVCREADAEGCLVRTSLSDVVMRLDARAGTHEFRLVEAVADTMIEAGIHPPNGRWFVDSRALSNDMKLGLGSSGAVAAGLVAAWAPHVDPEAALHLALDAHHRFQGRIGSGSDVIASAHGGLVRVQQGQPPQALAVPNELEHATIAVGAPADTRDMVRRMRAWRSAAPRVAAPLFDDLATAAAAGVYALSSMDIDGWLDAVRRYEACERALTHASGVPIITPEIEGAILAAANAGWVAKPSGAGGGDVVVAFSRGGDRDCLEEAVRSVGLSSISLALSPGGVLFAPLDRTSRT